MTGRLPGPGYPAPAKLNLFLHVVGRRADGYHLLQSAFTLIDRADRLRFAVRSDGQIRRLSDLPDVPAEADLVVRAARALQAACGTSLGADIEVDKALPLGGGLGGGSSDAATTLVVLNHLWQARLNRAQLQAIGGTLGAGHPLVVVPGPAAARGRAHGRYLRRPRIDPGFRTP